MAAVSTIIGAIGLGLGAIGTVTTMKGQQQQAQAANKAEALRKKQMTLDVARQRREIVRQQVMARSQALANATSQGAAQGTGLQGGYGQISSNSGNNMNYNRQSADIGYGMFNANMQATNAGTMASFGSGISNLGGTLMNNAQTIGRVGSYFAGKFGG